FSSRRRHTRLQGDWSSDVCSSDLPSRADAWIVRRALASAGGGWAYHTGRRALHRHKSLGDEPACRAVRLSLDRSARSHHRRAVEIGRASCRERGKMTVAALALKKK